MKFKVGGLDPDEDAERFRAAREAAGGGFVLAVDANQAWSPRRGDRFARLSRTSVSRWFEEPCRWHNDRRAMRDVRYGGGVPVCAGQSELSAGGCRDLMEAGAIDVCNFDASWSGGPTEWRRVAAIALAYDVRWATTRSRRSRATCSPRSRTAPTSSASIPTATRSGGTWSPTGRRSIDGTIELGEGPGLGWELDADYIDAHRVTA